MGFFSRLLARFVFNGVALFAATYYFPAFKLDSGLTTLAVGALVLTFLHTFIRPIFHLMATPFLWLTFGLFNIVINMALLWIADQMLTQLAIENLATLFWVSVMVSVANSLL